MTATNSRTATFLLREPRQTQGFREVLRGSPTGDVPFERLISEAERVSQFFTEEAALQAEPLTLTLLWIPPGRFWMGSPPAEPERHDSEGPQHLVQLQGFFLGQTPITQAQWRAVAQSQARPGERWGLTLNPNPSRFMGDKGGLFPGEANTDHRPVERVSWLEAIEFCSRLSQCTGRPYTLPSEAQWEYACRAGTTTAFHFGETITRSWPITTAMSLTPMASGASIENRPHRSGRITGIPVMRGASGWQCLAECHGSAGSINHQGCEGRHR
jgi:formylglycine-generating enzyme required for sulfatase activity